MRTVFVDSELGYGIAVAPKTGTLSIIRMLFEMRCGHPPEPGETEWLEELGMAHPASEAFAAGIPMIAVHRDPYERIRSAYQHRVVREGEAPARSFRAFCERLDYYRGYPSIAWHTDAQTHWLGDSAEPYAAVLTLEQLDQLPAVVSGLIGRPVPAMGRAHRMDEKPEWEEGLQGMLAPWVAGDLRAGWNGKTSRGLPEGAAR
ncbi:hypothetical protein [Luteolibacter marinus]|uniref:hypothetical protein n=1 Tax=Luteolibacter marinus TaxID=2776705 RepID=UPI0018664D77|nr:hypothetical protein [Luteolibacter marinus]